MSTVPVGDAPRNDSQLLTLRELIGFGNNSKEVTLT